MEAIQFTKATRKKAKLRLGIMGAAGSGKTLGALRVAKGIVSDMSKVFVIDTEHGSADLYANIGPYNTFTMSAPFGPLRYTEAIRAAEQAGAEVIIIDSASHAWEGEGGSLDQVDKKGGNSFTAWKDVTPQHRAMVEAMLQSNCHLIVTLRSKQEYVLETQTNKAGREVQVPVRKGMAPIMRAGFEYEMTVFVDVREDHHALATKDRTGLLDGKLIQLTEQVGDGLKRWLDAGVDAPAPAPVRATPTFTPAATQRYSLEDDGPAPAQLPNADWPQQAQPGGLAGGNLVEAVKMTQALKAKLAACETRAQGAALWDEVAKAGHIIGAASVHDLQNDLKKLAPTLRPE